MYDNLVALTDERWTLVDHCGHENAPTAIPPFDAVELDLHLLWDTPSSASQG